VLGKNFEQEFPSLGGDKNVRKKIKQSAARQNKFNEFNRGETKEH